MHIVFYSYDKFRKKLAIFGQIFFYNKIYIAINIYFYFKYDIVKYMYDISYDKYHSLK